MSEFSCDTVRDMLPLYVDNIISDDTKAIADVITEKPCEEDGWAHYMENVFFKEEGIV